MRGPDRGEGYYTSDPLKGLWGELFGFILMLSLFAISGGTLWLISVLGGKLVEQIVLSLESIL